MNGFYEFNSFSLVLGDTYSFLQQGSDQFRRAKVTETLRGIVVFEFDDGTTLKIFHQDQGPVCTRPPGEGLTTDRMTTPDGFTINEIQLYGGDQNDVANVVLQRRRQLDGPDRWSVNDRGSVLDKDGDWVIEPLPSNRSDEYLEVTRFATPDEAIAFWRQQEKPTRFWRWVGQD